MKNVIWISLAALGALAVCGAFAWCVIYVSTPGEAEWTTRSPAALGEFEQGLDDFERYYRRDAEEHFERALELDPEFVMARFYLSLLHLDRGEDSEERLAKLEECELETLQPQERFRVRFLLAAVDGRRDEAEAILDEFLDEHPTDLFGLGKRCEALWEARDWEAVEACYAHLIELHPNWVLAHNRLGFVAMAQGHFSEAEEHLATYRYVAPREAGAHTSLARLLILLGRYEEAEGALREALRLKDGDCDAHNQLLRTYYFSHRLDEAERVLEQLASIPACASTVETGWICRSRAFIAFQRGEAEQAWSLLEGECLERRGGYDLIGHHIALAAGRDATADAMEVELGRRLAAAESEGKTLAAEWYHAAQAHAEGLRLLWDGEYEAAGERLEEADRFVKYWDPEFAGFKILNRLTLAFALRRAGDDARADALIRKVEAVNPRIVRGLRMHDLELIDARQR